MKQIKSVFKAKEVGVFIALILLSVIFSVASPNFFQSDNILNVTRQMAVTSLVSIGMTFVIITGGIDLSVGAIIAVVGISVASLLNAGVPLSVSCFIGLIIGAAIGAVNSIFISKLNMSPFITTLGTMTILRGLGFLYTGGYPIYNLPKAFIVLGQGYFWGIPIPTIFLLFIAVIAHITLKFTPFGRHVYAVGGNKDASLFAGVKVTKISSLVYIISGIVCPMAAILQTSRIGSALPTMGLGSEMDAIAAVIIGGAAMSGGSGTILGTILGAGVLAVLNNGLSLLNVNSYIMQIVTGVVVILAISIDKLRKILSQHREVVLSRETLLTKRKNSSRNQ